MLSHFSHVQLFAILWTRARRAPLSMGFSRQEYWSGLPCPPPRDWTRSDCRRVLHCWATGEAPSSSLGNINPTLIESNIKFSLLRCRWEMCHKTTERNSSLLGKMKNVHETIYSRTLSDSWKRIWKPTSHRGCLFKRGSVILGFKLRVLKLRDLDLTPRFTTYWQSDLQKLNLSLVTYKMGKVILQIVLRTEVIHNAKGFWPWWACEKCSSLLI